MAPAILSVIRRHFDPGLPSGEFSLQWGNPTDVFSVLLILGGDVVGRALAQLVGSRVAPVAFSFGWVAYAVQAVVSVIGENKLIADPDYACKVINGRTGYVRDNSSWVIGRVVRDFENWMDDSKRGTEIRTHLQKMLADRWERDRREAEDKKRGSGKNVPRPSRAGLLVSVFTADHAEPGYPGYDWIYILGFPVAIFQLGIAAIPCGLFGDWTILLITAAGILLAFGTGGIRQWSEEKWACRRDSEKTVILTKGNGSQHAIVIIGDEKGLDLEDLAAGPAAVAASTSYTPIITVTILAVLWILLLITAAGIKHNTWFLIAVGAIGIVQNIVVAGWPRSPEAFGIPLKEEKRVFGERKVMDTLFAVEDKYPRVGRSMLATFFPGKLRPEEEERWRDEEPVEKRTLDRDGVAFYLSWHTFGLLEAVFCRNVPEALLLEAPAHGQAEMTQNRLKPMLQSWAVHVSEMGDRRYCNGYLDHVAATQRHAYNQFISLVAGDRLDYPGSDYLEIRRLMNYVACLGEALWVTTAGLFYRFLGPDSIPPALSWHSVPALGDHTMHSAVVADGWCPSTVNYLNLSANLSTLRLALFHGPLYEERHPECNAEKCALTQVDTENYVVQHTSQGCGCSFAGPDIHPITELLRQSSIPVIRINKGEGTDSTVSVSVLDGSSVEFVAFSHVWADGLGSTSEVGLPVCQLQRLAAMASNLVESGAFWIDGHCVPKDSDLRNLAIKMMADTYRRSKAVLVLDSGISAISTTDRTEIMLRVCISRWMRRLWTFQEAVLAKELCFKLSDRVVLINSIIPKFKDQLVDPALTGLGLFLATLTAHAQNQLFNITDVARAIQWRDTSKKADETLAIASLLNISAFKLACVAPEDRMRLLLLELGKLPRGLPFMQVEKLRTPGFTWAPSTFLYPSGQSMPRLDTEATCTPEGLMSKYYALIFDEVSIQQGERVRLDTDGDGAYLVGPERPLDGTYRCNAILLLQALSPGDAAQAIAVVFDSAAGTSPETPFIPYLYQRRVLIGRQHSSGTTGESKSVTIRTHGQLEVRIS